LFIAKIVIAALVIATTSSLARKSPGLAGFLMALPIASMLALPFSMVEHRDPAASVAFAKSILFAVPLSLLFFVPFLLAERLGLGFWACYGSGCALVPVAYLAHRSLVGG
jgi:uncharacterized membrane protein YczE